MMIGTALLAIWVVVGAVFTHTVLSAFFKERRVRLARTYPFLPLGRIRVDLIASVGIVANTVLTVLEAALELTSRIVQLVGYFVLWPLTLWWIRRAFSKAFPLEKEPEGEGDQNDFESSQ